MTQADGQPQIESPWSLANEADTSGVHETENGLVPTLPGQVAGTGIPAHVLSDLALKLAYRVPHLTTDWAAHHLCLSYHVTAELLEQLRRDRFLEVLGQTGPMGFRYAVSGPGRERAAHLTETCGYVGPAPVSLEAYSYFLERQMERLPEATPERVQASIADLVLPPEAIEIAGLATASGRSLFVHGPPGNGKSSVGHLLQRALDGRLWIPHCISVDNTVIRLFDGQCHEHAEDAVSSEEMKRVDQRWVCIRRPFVVVGGELTIDDLDLAYSPVLGCYEAPLPMKANGGIFLLDDLGCQRTPPMELLKRWIIPLENEVDYLRLQTGQKLQVPFRQMLIFSTNLDPDKVMEPALLRRLGYRIYFGNPTEERYVEIFKRYAAKYDLEPEAELIEGLIQRYRQEERPMLSCHPRDLIDRMVDIARYRRQTVKLTDELLDIAWIGYFGRK